MRKVDVGRKRQVASCSRCKFNFPQDCTCQGLHAPFPADIQHLHLSLYWAGVHSQLNSWLRSDLYFKGYTWHIKVQTRDISQVNLCFLLIILTTGLSSFWLCTFACQNYLCKIVVLCISISGRWEQICGEELSYVNSSDMQMYWHMLHMWQHLWSMHIYLNILNMLMNS